jgi:hypothetical protein
MLGMHFAYTLGESWKRAVPWSWRSCGPNSSTQKREVASCSPPRSLMWAGHLRVSIYNYLSSLIALRGARMKQLLSLTSKSAFIIFLAFAPQTTHAQDHATFDLPEGTFKAITRCLSQGNEVVMAPRLACVARQGGPGSGDRIARRALMPLGDQDWHGNWDEVCADSTDPRRLPANVIKRIASNKDEPVAPTGIRIIGAVFCGAPNGAALDLAGLDLPYSLVIDRSVVNGYLDARNLRIKGDFSFDNSVVLQSLRLNRARIDGSVYASGSFVDRLLVSDTQVSGSWMHPNSVIFRDAQFLRAGISGDLNIDGSAFSLLWVLSSHIAGILDLSETEARCGYHISSSTTGYLLANHAGFGIIKSLEASNSTIVEYPWWNRKLSGTPKPHTQEIFESPAIARIAAAERYIIGREAVYSYQDRLRGCEELTADASPQFVVSSSTVEDSLCLASFVWLAPRNELPDDAHPTSILTLNRTRINGSLMINLWGEQPSPVADLQPKDPRYRLVSDKQKFEAIGLTAGSLIFNLSDVVRPYFAYFDELKFNRVYKAIQSAPLRFEVSSEHKGSHGP